MALTRSFTSAGQVTDWTPEVSLIPRNYSKIGSLGLFEEIPVAADTVTFDQIIAKEVLIQDKIRGSRALVGKDRSRKTYAWQLPHYPLDDFILPGDIKGKRAYGSPDMQDTKDAVIARKLEFITRQQENFLEYARSQLITTGTVYAPNGTVVLNYFTEFGVSQQTTSFALGTGTTDLLSKNELVIRQIQDNLLGSSMTGIIALCSPEFFTAYTSHAAFKDAYKYFASSELPLRNRVGNDITSFYRTINFGDITFIEIPDSYYGNRLIDAGSAYFVPAGSDIFKTYFGPADKFGLMGTLGEKLYVWQYPENIYDDKIEIQSESNFLNACVKPQLIVRGTVA